MKAGDVVLTPLPQADAMIKNPPNIRAIRTTMDEIRCIV